MKIFSVLINFTVKTTIKLFMYCAIFYFNIALGNDVIVEVKSVNSLGLVTDSYLIE